MVIITNEHQKNMVSWWTNIKLQTLLQVDICQMLLVLF